MPIEESEKLGSRPYVDKDVARVMLSQPGLDIAAAILTAEVWRPVAGGPPIEGLVVTWRAIRAQLAERL